MLGRRSTIVTLVMVAVAIGLTFVSSSWIAWTVLLIVMLVTIGPRHPRTLDEEIPLDRGRLLLAAIAMVMLIVCFTPAPIEPFVTGLHRRVSRHSQYAIRASQIGERQRRIANSE